MELRLITRRSLVLYERSEWPDNPAPAPNFKALPLLGRALFFWPCHALGRRAEGPRPRGRCLGTTTDEPPQTTRTGSTNSTAFKMNRSITTHLEPRARTEIPKAAHLEWPQSGAKPPEVRQCDFYQSVEAVFARRSPNTDFAGAGQSHEPMINRETPAPQALVWIF
jgi:hypothetical protein